MGDNFIIGTFYRFKPLSNLPELRSKLLRIMKRHSVFGTIIIAEEGFNGGVSALPEDMERFLAELSGVVGRRPDCKFSGHVGGAFKRRKVKIKSEIVTLKKHVDMRLGAGTHIAPEDWDEIAMDPGTVLVDARNDYEFRVGSFKGALNPGVESFSEIPGFIESNLSPKENESVAMFCTGGIRCEKLAPYLIAMGFRRVFQLQGGILNYLGSTQNASGLWEGECFVFDERVTVDDSLRKGSAPDFSSLKPRSLKPPQ